MTLVHLERDLRALLQLLRRIQHVCSPEVQSLERLLASFVSPSLSLLGDRLLHIGWQKLEIVWDDPTLSAAVVVPVDLPGKLASGKNASLATLSGQFLAAWKSHMVGCQSAFLVLDQSELHQQSLVQGNRLTSTDFLAIDLHLIRPLLCIIQGNVAIPLQSVVPFHCAHVSRLLTPDVFALLLCLILQRNLFTTGSSDRDRTQNALFALLDWHFLDLEFNLQPCRKERPSV
mmetsp:Transcript_76860/g.176365  ORF Transcript_76860/g.176365 Transcript_76860/m.176365 type:complete len:231 (-) Transcript_76860:306-998(-)